MLKVWRDGGGPWRICTLSVGHQGETLLVAGWRCDPLGWTSIWTLSFKDNDDLTRVKKWLIDWTMTVMWYTWRNMRNSSTRTVCCSFSKWFSCVYMVWRPLALELTVKSAAWLATSNSGWTRVRTGLRVTLAASWAMVKPPGENAEGTTQRVSESLTSGLGSL